MILLAFGSGDCVNRPVLQRMFRARKEVFADLLKWEVPIIGGKYEIDQFDDEKAIYIVVTDETGRHRASARLLATTRPHILGDLFPFLCHHAVPTGADTFEITRFCLDRRQNAKERRLARNRLISGLVEFAIGRAIRTYTGVAEIAWLQQVLAFGWKCRPLGEPRLINGSLVGALSIDIGVDTPGLLASNGIWAPEPLWSAELSQAA